MTAEAETVCVTGASGFIGSWVVSALLDKGYIVRAQVQNLRDEEETGHLKEWAATKAKGKLSLHEADLLDAIAIAKAVGQSKGVFHLASPNTLDPVPDPEGFLVEPAVHGTLNVLKAAHSVNAKRVVLTASISSLIPNPSLPPRVVVDESSWTDVEYCKKNGIWYSLSKTLAEKAAWDFVDKTGLDMVAINPACVIGGPMLQSRLNASYGVLLNLLKGSREPYDHIWLGTVHVKDVAQAHVLLYEAPSAKGRHVCSEAITPFSEFANLVADLYPQYDVPRFEENTHPNLVPCANPAKKLNVLGLQFTPREVAIRDAVTSLQQQGFVPAAAAAQNQ